MKQILPFVKQFLDSKLPGVEYEVVDEIVFTGRYGKRLHFFMQDNQKLYNFQYVIDEEAELMMVICFYPDKFNTELIGYIYPFVNLINYNQIIDAAVLDPDDGELSFRIGYDLRGIEMNSKIAELAFATLIKTIRQYANQLDQLSKATDMKKSD